MCSITFDIQYISFISPAELLLSFILIRFLYSTRTFFPSSTPGRRVPDDSTVTIVSLHSNSTKVRRIQRASSATLIQFSKSFEARSLLYVAKERERESRGETIVEAFDFIRNSLVRFLARRYVAKCKKTFYRFSIFESPFVRGFSRYCFNCSVIQWPDVKRVAAYAVSRTGLIGNRRKLESGSQDFLYSRSLALLENPARATNAYFVFYTDNANLCSRLKVCWVK